MSDFHKRMNLYKSTMGQVDKLIKEADDEDIKETSIQSRECIVNGQQKEMVTVLKVGFNILAGVFEGLADRCRGTFE